MQTVFNSLEAWLWKLVINIVFAAFNGIFLTLSEIFNNVFPIIADILRINPFGTTTFTYSATGATLDLSGVASFVEGASQTLQFLGVELALLFGIYGMLKASASLIELKRAEHIFVHFIKFGIVIWAITNIYDVIETLFDIFIGANDILIDYGSGSMSPTVSTSILSTNADFQALLSGVNSVSQVGDYISFTTECGVVVKVAVSILPFVLLFTLVVLVIFICSAISIFTSIINISKEMIARLVRFYLHLIICPLVLPMGLTEGTKQSLRSYFTSLAGVALEWVLSVELILIVGKMLAVIPTAIQDLFLSIIDSVANGVLSSSTTAVGIVLAFASPVVIVGVYSLILNIMKSLMGKLDTIAKGMLSLGGI